MTISAVGDLHTGGHGVVIFEDSGSMAGQVNAEITFLYCLRPGCMALFPISIRQVRQLHCWGSEQLM